MNKVHQLKPYEAPLVELIEVEVEQGFALSTEDVGKTHDEQDW